MKSNDRNGAKMSSDRITLKSITKKIRPWYYNTT